MPEASPSTVQLRRAPIDVPAIGTLQVPRVTSGAVGQEIMPAAQRTSYFAGKPVPSLTSVNDSVTELSVTAETVRSVTVPGGDAGGGGGGGGGGAVTVIVAVPVWPSLVAVMVAAPAATADTRPLALTVATDALLVVQVTTRPDSGLPPASFGVAVSCTVCPACTLAVAGVTATDATGTTVTVIVAPPDCPSLVAVMVATPTATLLTRPLPFTVAIAELLVAHVTTRPLSGVPLASFGVAASCTV